MIDISVEPAAWPVSGQVCAMFAADIVSFTGPGRDQDIRLHQHKALYEILEEGFQGSGMPWPECYHEDRGDGALVVVPPATPAHGIIDPLPERLRLLIRRYNRLRCEAARMQLRAVAHIGPVYHDGHGLVGDDVNLLSLMLDARPLRRALSDSGAELTMMISSYMYDSLVCRHPSLVDPALFRPLNTRVNRTRIHGWLFVPGERPV
jgi:hypothetical protein